MIIKIGIKNLSCFRTLVKGVVSSYEFRSRFIRFLDNAHLKWLDSEIVKNLKFLLEASISGKNIALLFDNGLKVKDAASDPRYLFAISTLMDCGVTPDIVVPLLKAKSTIYRLLNADKSLMSQFWI